MIKKIHVGLTGYGKAGKAVANILSTGPRLDLRWIVRRSASTERQTHPEITVLVIGIAQQSFDTLVDFSSPESIHAYGEEVRKRGIMLVSALSACAESDLDCARGLGWGTRVPCSHKYHLVDQLK